MFKETCRDFYSPGKGNLANSQQKSSHGTFQYEADKHSNVMASPVLRHGTSSAEETIVRAQGSQPNSSTDVYPKRPLTGRASDFPLGFRGCMNCGDPGHAFRDCADRNSLEAKSRFHSNFNAHKPHITAARELRQSQQSGDKRPRPSERVQSHYGPASSGDATARQRESQAQSRSCEPVRRVYRTFVHRAITLRGRTTLNKREMPITLQKNLPTLLLRLGDSSNKHGDIELKVLFDTCGALSTGFKPHHDRIRQLHPELVHAYESFDKINPFEPIRLSGALRNPDDVSQEVTGALTSVIRYKTPYVDCNCNPVLLSFDLGDTVSCNTILGLSAINGMNMIWNVRNATVCAEGLQGPNNVFSVNMCEAQYGFQVALCDTADDTPASPRPPARVFGFSHRLAESHQAPCVGPHGHLTDSTRTPTKAAPVLLVGVPSNIWRPKQHNTWSNPDYADDIDEDLLVFK
jgi:hypothetical protein